VTGGSRTSRKIITRLIDFKQTKELIKLKKTILC